MCAPTCAAFTAAGSSVKMIPPPLLTSRRFVWAGRSTIWWSIRRKESRVWEGESGNLPPLLENTLKPGAGAIFVKGRSIPSPAAGPFARPLAAAALGTVLIVLGAASEGRSATFDQPTLAASKLLEAKMQILESKDPQPSAPNPAVVITEFEANSYLKVHSGEFLPTGVRTP